MSSSMIALGIPGGWEWIVIVIIALLIFGRRLPDVARSVGKSIVEFKKGIKDVKEDIDTDARLESKTDNSAPLDKSATTNSHDSPA